MTEELNEVGSVICSTCHTQHYEVIDLKYNQAIKCASDLFADGDRFVSYSHYGSNFDLTKFKFSTGSTYQIGNICDSCIEKAVAEGVAVECSDFNPVILDDFDDYQEDFVSNNEE